MAKRFVDSRKFQDPWFRNLAPEYKCFWDYLICSCDHAGIWKVDFKLAEFCIGAVIDETVALEVLNDRIVKVSKDKWFIPKFITFQYKNLNRESKLFLSLKTMLLDIGYDEDYLKGLITLTKGLGKPFQRLKDKDKSKNKDKEGVIGETDFIDSLKTNPAYKHINLEQELGKMDAWLMIHKGRQKTKKFVLNWLNKIESPLPITTKPRYIPPVSPPPEPCDPKVAQENMSKLRALVGSVKK